MFLIFESRLVSVVVLGCPGWVFLVSGPGGGMEFNSVKCALFISPGSLILKDLKNAFFDLFRVAVLIS